MFEESANEGFEFAFFKLIEFYSKGEFKDIDTAEYWLDQARKRGFDESRFLHNEKRVENEEQVEL